MPDAATETAPAAKRVRATIDTACSAIRYSAIRYSDGSALDCSAAFGSRYPPTTR
jgi:hypothetical protein